MRVRQILSGLALVVVLPCAVLASPYEVRIRFEEGTQGETTCINKMFVEPSSLTINRGAHLQWFGGDSTATPPAVTWIVENENWSDYTWSMFRKSGRNHFQDVQIGVPNGARLEGPAIINYKSVFAYGIHAKKADCEYVRDPEVIFNGGGGRKGLTLLLTLAVLVSALALVAAFYSWVAARRISRELKR